LQQDITAWAWSPNGKQIAFLSRDEITQEEDVRLYEKRDDIVFGPNWKFARLRYLDVELDVVRTLVEKAAHVADFAWNQDFSRIVSITHESKVTDSAGYKGSKFEQADLSIGQCQGLADFPELTADLIWEVSNIYFRAGAIPEHSSTSWMTYILRSDQGQWSKHAYGEDNCAVQICHSDFQSIIT